MSQRSKTLKFMTQMALNYAHYHMTFESMPVDDPTVIPGTFLKQQYEMSEHIEGSDEIIVIGLKHVNMSETINIKNNIDFSVNFTYTLADSTVTEVNVEIMDIDFLEGENIRIFIKDFVNNYMKYLFTGLVKVYLDYDEISVENTEQTVFLGSTLQLNFILDKKNNIQPSIKTLFLNDMDVIFDIDYDPKLIEKLREYSKELVEPVSQLFDSNKQMVGALYDFDDGSTNVDVKLIQENFGDILNKKPETVDEIMKHLILNAIIRSGQATLANMLALYDSTEYLSVNSIIYSTLIEK